MPEFLAFAQIAIAILRSYQIITKKLSAGDESAECFGGTGPPFSENEAKYFYRMFGQSLTG